LENVYGTITSHEGKDFRAIANAFAQLGYRFGAVVVDARLFVPQSRPRLFIMGVREDLEIPKHLTGSKPSIDLWHPPKLIDAYASLTREVTDKWIWWQLPVPAKGNITFSDVVDEDPISVRWHTSEETARLLAMMSPINFAKVVAAKKLKRRLVGGVYKRTRHDASGKKVQRAEVRFDGVAGCLRTPAGGSSRQTILVIDGEKVRSRLLAPREAARLMGLPEDYKLPENYNEAYHLVGDGVAVPVVRHLAENLFEPILRSKRTIRRAA
jgi:DNA (cytosine-5)-methyltransferase 1